MRVLLIGSGGREHALADALLRSRSVTELIAAPGNPGIAQLGECRPVEISNPEAIADLADDIDPDLVVIGPEIPLVAGAVDALEARGHLAFGPRADAANLEGSKVWMKEVVESAGVPTARHGSFRTGEESEAVDFLDTISNLWVIKTDGLAAGKGVLVTDNKSEAADAIHSYLGGAAFGDAGKSLVVEEGLTGPEFSVLVLCDGNGGAIPFSAAQDHKRVGTGDTGPNTGGMGAYSPVPFVTDSVIDEVMGKAVLPTLVELENRGIGYRGILYAGMMLTPAGPKVLEYNVRFGDPEAQVVLTRITSDIFVHLYEAATGALETPVTYTPEVALNVVLAAPGYPTSTRVGDRISGLETVASMPGVTVFHCGTKMEAGQLVTAGGRVLAVTAIGSDLAEARNRTYGACERITFDGKHNRTDIGELK